MPEARTAPAQRDRYRSLGLIGNPFAAPPLNAPALTAFVDRGLPDPPPPGSTTLVQVIGESGMGKSTQVQRWRAHTPGPYHWIPRTPYASRWQKPPQPQDLDGVVYGDEIDRMPAPIRHRWFNRLAAADVTLVIGTHVDLTALGTRSGFQVITHRLQPVGHELLSEIANRRLIDAAADAETPFQFSPDEVAGVADRSGGNPGAADVFFHKLLAGHAQRHATRDVFGRR